MRPKRLISLLVAVCMMITMLPLSAVTAFAEDTSTEYEATIDGYEYFYKVNEGGKTVTITRFFALDVSHSHYADIPETLGDGNYTVTAIGKNAFFNCQALAKVTIPQSVTSIGDGAFQNSSLTDVTIPQGVTSIGEDAFYNCYGLTSVTIPQSVASIGKQAFRECRQLKSLTIKDAATSIGEEAFMLCESLTTLKLGEKIKTIGESAFSQCGLTSVTIPDSVTSIGDWAFGYCNSLTALSLGENIETIGAGAFYNCAALKEITIPDSVTSIGDSAFGCCTSLTTLSLGKNIETIGGGAFYNCSSLSKITIPEKVKEIKSKHSYLFDGEVISEEGTFEGCSSLKSITLPAEFTSFQASLDDCPADCVIYFNNDEDTADERFNSHTELAGRKLLCLLCNVTFDANGGKLNDYDGNLTDHAVVPVYKTEKITKDAVDKLTPTRAGYNFTGWYTTADDKFDVDKTEITKNTTFYARWDKVPVCHPLTVTGGIVTVKKDGQSLNIVPDVTGDKKTYSVPEGATVTVTLDKTAVPNGKVFDGWSTTLPTGQDYKTESITFTMNTMNSNVNVSAKYRDAATDHTPGTAVCHPLTVTGGIITVKYNGNDVTSTLNSSTDATTGQKTYYVPDGAKVTVTLDKTLIPEGMVFDIWSTGKFSLPLDQDYKAESITFTMNTMSSDADIAAQYRDATIEDDGPNVLGTAAIIGTAAVGTAVLGYQAYSLGAEFAGKLMALPYFPSNRSALAMMLWEDAGKPMPESELLYPDVEQEEQDMDLQHAARWAMENELIPDLNDEGTAPEEMKFYPDNTVSKIDVLNAWQKAQELKNN